MLLSVPLKARPRLGRRVIVPFAAALMLAWLPSLTYLGHWEQLVPNAPAVQHSHSQGSDHAHSAHCHDGLASCADHAPAQSPAVGRTLESAPTPPEARVPLTADVAPSAASEKTPPTPPPRLPV